MKSNVSKLPPAEGWLAPILAAADAQDAIEQAGEGIAAGIAADAASAAPEARQPIYAYSGHTDGSNAVIAMQTTILESEIDNINTEIRMTVDESANLVRMIEANRDDRLGRLYAKRDNALLSAEALQAAKRTLGQ